MTSSRGPLHGQNVLVVGAAGGVGQGIAGTFLDAGATVIAMTRSRSRYEELSRRLSEGREVPLALKPLFGELSWSSEAREHIADAVAEHCTSLDGVVVSIGNWVGAGIPIQKLDELTWESCLRDNLTSHLIAMQVFTPMLSRRGAFVHISGLSAEVPFPPAPAIAATNAARRSLALTLAEELRQAGPRVYELVIGVIRTPARIAGGFTEERLYTPAEIGQYIVGLVADTERSAEAALHRLVDRDTDAGGSDAGSSLPWSRFSRLS